MTRDLPYSETGLATELEELKGSQVYLWLQEQLRVNSKNMTILRDDIQFRWLQGQTQHISSLLESIDEATEKAWNAREMSRKHEALKQQRQNLF